MCIRDSGVTVTVTPGFGLQQYRLFAHFPAGLAAGGGVSHSFKGMHWFGFGQVAIGAIVGVGVGASEQDTHWPLR